jgi:signal transduction histidine kinase
MRETLPTLALAVERDAIVKRNAAAERALVETAERRLTRLGLDLHDGPLQDLALLGQDLRLFGDQLERAIGADAERELLRGRLEDLDAQLVELEAGLRRISSSVHATVLTQRPFSAAAQSLADAFAARTGIEPRLTLRGEMSALSASQRIALLSILKEALNNIREHSNASKVTITICTDANGVEAQVFDNGCGFDVETALVSAARRGRMGLAGALERVRLLGGQCGIESKPGGPTAISIALPRWQPLTAVPDSVDAEAA